MDRFSGLQIAMLIMGFVAAFIGASVTRTPAAVAEATNTFVDLSAEDQAPRARRTAQPEDAS